MPNTDIRPRAVVTAIIPAMVDGDRPYLEDAILSVRNQSVDCNCVVVFDQDLHWVTELKQKFLDSPEITFIGTVSSNAATARNFGVLVCNTPFVAFLDADDQWARSKIEAQLETIGRVDCDLVGCDHYLVSVSDRVFGHSLSRNIPMPSSWLVKRRVMEARPFNEALRKHEDGDWWMNNYRELHIVRLPRPLLRYRVRPSSMSSGTRSKRRKEKLASFASIPVASAAIFFLTWILWALLRSNRYHPARDWARGRLA